MTQEEREREGTGHSCIKVSLCTNGFDVSCSCPCGSSTDVGNILRHEIKSL